MVWTTYQNVVDRWTASPAINASQAKVETLIGDAEDTILTNYPTIQARIDATTLPVARVQKVVSRMVIRHLLNPTGQRSASEARGPFTATVTYGGDEPGSIYLTDQDRRELQESTHARGKAFVVDNTPAGAFGLYQSDCDLWDRIT